MDILDGAYRERTQFILSNLRRYKLSKNEKMLPFTVSMLACLEAYNVVYPESYVIEDLRNLKTPDSRKVDLFYRGMAIIMRMAFFPDEDWNKLYKGWNGGLFAASMKFQSCFISYSSFDDEFARLLYAELRKRKIKCWFSPRDMPVGGKLLDEVHEAINFRDRIIVILSEHSIQSDWVEDEVTVGFENERILKKIVIFPIKVDNTVLVSKKAWAVKLRGRHIGDFTNWRDPEHFKREVKSIISHLKIAPT